MNTKLHLTLYVALFLSATLYAQPVLTSGAHTFRVGDSHDFILMKTAPEGISGSNVIWDFSALEANGKTLTSHMLSTDITDKTNSFPESNLVLEEFGNQFIFNVTKNSMEQNGSVSCNTVTIYDKPFVKLLFPFHYGDNVKGQYSGVQITGTTKSSVKGEYNIEADAYGTLLLPNNIEINNVLRVKQTRTIDYGNGGKTTEITYRWYSATIRYPILVIIKYVTAQQSSIAETAMYAHVNSQLKSATAVNQVNAISDLDVYPNPFDEKLTIHYNLAKPGKVSIDLYDVSGRSFTNVLNTLKQSSGIQSQAIESAKYQLVPGIYYVRIMVDNTVYTKKVLKIK